MHGPSIMIILPKPEIQSIFSHKDINPEEGLLAKGTILTDHEAWIKE